MAELIPWQKEYRLGNRTIDSEHEQLFTLANRILSIADASTAIEALRPILHELYDYMRYHFTREEALMRQIAFAGHDRHKGLHQEIIQALNRILKTSHDYEELTERLSKVMIEWLLQHILKEDFKLKPLLEPAD